MSPQGDEIKIVVRLYFNASNNEAEYEALLVGLQAARYVGVARVILYLESQLVARRLEGANEITNDRLRKYIDAYEKLKN